MQIGIGTYSFGGTASFYYVGPTLYEKLQMIKSMGFNSVELLTVDLEHDLEDVKRWLDETGITVTSVHAFPTEEIVKKAAQVGAQAVIWPATDFCNKEEAIEVAKELDAMAEMAEPYGIKIAYHNHEMEFFFDEGKTLMEHVLDNSSKCYMQLDCGWASYAGTYSPSFIRKYKDRIISIHVKENNKVFGPGPRPKSRHANVPVPETPWEDPRLMPLEKRQAIVEQILKEEAASGKNGDDQCPMGAPDSNIDWKEIKRALDEQNIEAFWIVEREGFYGEHDACIEEDCAYIMNNIATM